MLLESDQVVSLLAEVELLIHHSAKHVHFFWERDPLHSRKESNDVSKDGHDFEVAGNHFGHAWMEHFEGDGGGWDIWKRFGENVGCQGTNSTML